MDFFFCTEREFEPDNFSQLIQETFNIGWSHNLILVSNIPIEVRVRLGLHLSDDIVYHATIPKYARIPLSQELAAGSEIVHKIQIEVQDEMFALGWLEGNMDKEYSFSQCAALIYPHLRPLFGNGPGKGFCSEFAMRFAKTNSIRSYLLTDVDPEWVDPGQKTVELMISLLSKE